MAWLVLFLGWLVLLCSCHDAPRNNPFDPTLTPPVELQVALDDTAGTASLTWTPYLGKAAFPRIPGVAQHRQEHRGGYPGPSSCH